MLRTHPILLYDGVCGLCNHLVQFILRHDRNDVFRFASLQSSLATSMLTRHGAASRDLDTVYVVPRRQLAAKSAINTYQASESLLSRSEAVIFALKELGGIWRLAGFLLQMFPRFLRNWAYDQVARNRYRIFGRFETCPVPTASTRGKFLDIEEETVGK